MGAPACQQSRDSPPRRQQVEWVQSHHSLYYNQVFTLPSSDFTSPGTRFSLSTNSHAASNSCLERDHCLCQWVYKASWIMDYSSVLQKCPVFNHTHRQHILYCEVKSPTHTATTPWPENLSVDTKLNTCQRYPTRHTFPQHQPLHPFSLLFLPLPSYPTFPSHPWGVLCATAETTDGAPHHPESQREGGRE